MSRLVKEPLREDRYEILVVGQTLDSYFHSKSASDWLAKHILLQNSSA
jgi:hypothetical protein